MRLYVFALAALFSVASSLAPSLRAQTSNELVGAWSFVLNETTNADGTKTNTFGVHPKGILMFDSGGNFSLFIANPDRPKFASNSRLQGTSAENESAVHNSISYYGKYRVDENGKVMVLELGGCSFPNWDGAVQRRPFTVTGDELRFTNAVGSGGGSVLAVLKRVKP